MPRHLLTECQSEAHRLSTHNADHSRAQALEEAIEGHAWPRAKRWRPAIHHLGAYRHDDARIIGSPADSAMTTIT